MSIELIKSSHGTAKSDRHETVRRTRSQSWTDKADLFHVNCQNGWHFVDIRCDKWQCFRFSHVDFVEVIKTMLATLPLSKLIELNVFLAALISENSNKEIE